MSATSLVHRGSDLLYFSNDPLGPFPDTLLAHLAHWAQATPSAVFLAERVPGGGWATLTYGEAAQWVDAAARHLLRLRCVQGDRLLLVSENSIAHGVLALAALSVGVAVVPLSPSYLGSAVGLERVGHVVRIARPKFLHVSAQALATAAGPVRAEGATEVPPHDLQACRAETRSDAPAQLAAALQERRRAVDGSSVAKILFTSGTTGTPKGVINTQRMLCAQQQQMAQLWRFLGDHPPVLCEWLPWSHTSGGNNSFNMTLRNGGALYIDDGRPTLEGIAETARNIAEVRPTWYTNVPLGYSALLPVLQQDRALAGRFFSRLDLLVYGGAALSAEVWSGIDALARSVTGKPAPWASGWGLTETTSTIAITHGPVSAAGQVGTPLPGMTCRLSARDGLYAIAVKGPNVTPGYLGDAAATGVAFDDEGFFVTGDAVSFADAAAPDRGLRFEGRFAEQFKLASGTWVIPNRIKRALFAVTGPLVRDVVLEGPDRPHLAALLWLNDELARRDFGWSREIPWDDPRTAPLREHLERLLARHNAQCLGSSERLARWCVLADPPSTAQGELTEKGTIQIERFRALRQPLIDSLYP
ncbi:MAG: AMP-binding protein [Pseudomonadota bacterium]